MPLTPTEKMRCRYHQDDLPGAAVRLCLGCTEMKPVEDFNTRKHVSGVRVPCSRCKACDAGRMLAYRLAHPERMAALQRAYTARLRSTPEGAEVLRNSNKEWHQRHPEYSREHYAHRRSSARGIELMRAGNQRYKARVRAAGAGPTAVEVREMLTWPCVYCDAPATELDHVVPIARGGEHVCKNLVPACRSCNASKGSKLLSEWRVPCL